MSSASDKGLLSLKWNNHKSTFLSELINFKANELFCDVSLTCDGNFYPLHKLVLSTCSDYFQEMFEMTQCKHPIIVLKDIKCEELEALIDFMYFGEVKIMQEKLGDLIKAAEYLKVKGLAISDEMQREKKNQSNSTDSHKNSDGRKEESMETHQDVKNSIENFLDGQSSNLNEFSKMITKSESNQDSSSSQEEKVGLSLKKDTSVSPMNSVIKEENSPSNASDSEAGSNLCFENHNSKNDNSLLGADASSMNPISSSNSPDTLYQQLNLQSLNELTDELSSAHENALNFNFSISNEISGGVSNRKEKTFKCQLCTYSSSNAHLLRSHMRSHSDERPYSCQYCSYKAKHVHHLQRHIRTHTGEKPFNCLLCPFKSNRNDYLKRHIIVAHTDPSQLAAEDLAFAFE